MDHKLANEMLESVDEDLLHKLRLVLEKYEGTMASIATTVCALQAEIYVRFNLADNRAEWQSGALGDAGMYHEFTQLVILNIEPHLVS